MNNQVSTRRFDLVMNTADRLGMTRTAAAKEIGYETAGGLYSVLLSRKPQGPTIVRIMEWLTSKGVSVAYEDLLD